MDWSGISVPAKIDCIWTPDPRAFMHRSCEIAVLGTALLTWDYPSLSLAIVSIPDS